MPAAERWTLMVVESIASEHQAPLCPVKASKHLSCELRDIVRASPPPSLLRSLRVDFKQYEELL